MELWDIPIASSYFKGLFCTGRERGFYPPMSFTVTRRKNKTYKQTPFTVVDGRLSSLSREMKNFFCSPIYEWYKKMPLSSLETSKQRVIALLVLKTPGSHLVVTMWNWNQLEQNSNKRRNAKEMRHTTKTGRQRRTNSHRQDLCSMGSEKDKYVGPPEVPWALSTLALLRSHNSAYLRINFRAGYSHQLASRKCIRLPGSSEWMTKGVPLWESWGV